jgi:hypothetical protein
VRRAQRFPNATLKHRKRPLANLDESGVGRGWLLILLCRFSAVMYGHLMYSYPNLLERYHARGT